MPGSLGSCSFPGLDIRYASMSFSRGVTPSICTILAVPQDNLNLPPSTLTFSYGSTSVQFFDCAVMGAFIRPRRDGKGWLMSVQVMDRRWRWAFKSISGEYNKRKPDGTVDDSTRKTPAELADLCFNVLGDRGNTSQMPGGVYPYVNWQNTNAALALADLCDRVACDVVLNHAANSFEVWPLGVGPGTETGFGEFHPKYRFTPRNVPSGIEAHGGDSQFQNKLRIRAVADNEQGQQAFLATTFNTITLNQQAFHFPGLTATQHIALEQAWKDYRVIGQADSSLAVPQCQEAITSTDQYLLNSYILDPAEKDLSQFQRRLPYYVEGDFWAYADTPTSLSDKRCLMPSSLDLDRRLVRFQYPVVKLGSSGLIEEPTLYLTTSYRVKAVDGSISHLVRSGNTSVTGGGTLVLRRPEVFASFKTTYNGQNSAGQSSTKAQAEAELDRYVQIFQQKYTSTQASELTYPGTIAGNLNGTVAQIRWTAGVNRNPTTMACEHEELDVTAVPKTERRRREILRQIQEALG